MSLHLFSADLAIPQDQPSSSRVACEHRLLAAYEDGSVVLRRFPNDSPKQTSVEGIGWEVIFSAKLHKEASKALISSSPCLTLEVLVMAMRVSADNTFALTVSADHIVGQYDLSVCSVPLSVYLR
jgi:ASTRA-associated protein 1